MLDLSKWAIWVRWEREPVAAGSEGGGGVLSLRGVPILPVYINALLNILEWEFIGFVIWIINIHYLSNITVEPRYKEVGYNTTLL